MALDALIGNRKTNKQTNQEDCFDHDRINNYNFFPKFVLFIVIFSKSI